MESILQIVETGSFTSKERLNEAIDSLSQRAKLCRERMAIGVMSVTMAANEIEACNTWIECFKELKNILDACCGSRMFWFDKNNTDVLFADIRKESMTLCDGRFLDVNPDIQLDFRDMPFDSNTFKLVVFDPPHLNKLGKSSWMAKKYGVLFPTWEQDIELGFNECMRVLDKNGVLIFKWNESQISVKKIISIIGQEPLFGHVTGRHGKTIWMAFMKS